MLCVLCAFKQKSWCIVVHYRAGCRPASAAQKQRGLSAPRAGRLATSLASCRTTVCVVFCRWFEIKVEYIQVWKRALRSISARHTAHRPRKCSKVNADFIVIDLGLIVVQSRAQKRTSRWLQAFRIWSPRSSVLCSLTTNNQSRVRRYTTRSASMLAPLST